MQDTPTIVPAGEGEPSRSLVLVRAKPPGPRVVSLPAVPHLSTGGTVVCQSGSMAPKGSWNTEMSSAEWNRTHTLTSTHTQPQTSEAGFPKHLQQFNVAGIQTLREKEAGKTPPGRTGTADWLEVERRRYRSIEWQVKVSGVCGAWLLHGAPAALLPCVCVGEWPPAFPLLRHHGVPEHLSSLSAVNH